MANQQYSELLKPGRIGKLELRNRIVMAPMGTYLAGRDGLITDRLKSYYAERAAGGAGLIIAEVASVDYPRGRVMTRQIGISDDKFIPGLADLSAAVHEHGAALSIQLQHGGRLAAPFLSGGNEAVSASVVPLVPRELGVTRELTVEEIVRLEHCFAQAAVRAKTAGFDAVEIHAGHGYLINQFLSRSTNRRSDKYGGDLPNRARFLLNIIKSVRESVGQDFPVWCRIDGREFAIENGITREEALETAQMTEQAGVDAVHVSGYGGSMGVHFTEAPLVNTPEYLVPLAKKIKQSVGIPVITAGRISPESAEKVLRDSAADFIAMGRPLLADPELPRKLVEGANQDIRKCIYCYTCVHQIFVRSNICCAINPAVGKESEPLPLPPEKIKNVLVAGGGPAGMEAAITAAIRGHSVTLYEKEDYLGGSLYFASIFRRENEDLITFFSNQLKKMNVRVNLSREVTPALVEELRPDVLILAAGAVRRNPPIPGIDGKNVINGEDLRQMLSGRLSPELAHKLDPGGKALLDIGRPVLKPLMKPGSLGKISRLWMPLGKKVAVLGTGTIGLELAAFLVERGRKVTLLEDSEQMAPEMALPFKWMIMEKLEKHGTTVMTGVKYQEITAHGINIITLDGTKQSVEADTVVVATGTEPDTGISAAFQGKAPEIYLVGDCNKLSFIKDSISDGHKIASTI